MAISEEERHGTKQFQPNRTGPVEPAGGPIKPGSLYAHNREATVSTLLEEARTRVRAHWLDVQPENERILVHCEECQEKLREIKWREVSDHGPGRFEPDDLICSRHPELFQEWLSDITRTLNLLKSEMGPNGFRDRS